MLLKRIMMVLIVSSLLGACATTTTSKIDTSQLSIVKENHAEITIDKVDYIFDSYIILFQRPYYITVSRSDKAAIEKDIAVAVASEYIKPRGCTTPLSRRPDLDQNNSDKTQWLIGIEC